MNLSFHIDCKRVSYENKSYETNPSTTARKESMNAIIEYIDKNSDRIFSLKDFKDLLSKKNLFGSCIRYIWNQLQIHYEE